MDDVKELIERLEKRSALMRKITIPQAHTEDLYKDAASALERLLNPWKELGDPGDNAPFDGSPVIGGEPVDGDGWVSYEMQYCSDKGHEGFYLAGYHWTDAVEGQMYPKMWMPMPSGPASRTAALQQKS